MAPLPILLYIVEWNVAPERYAVHGKMPQNYFRQSVFIKINFWVWNSELCMARKTFKNIFRQFVLLAFLTLQCSTCSKVYFCRPDIWQKRLSIYAGKLRRDLGPLPVSFKGGLVDESVIISLLSYRNKCKTSLVVQMQVFLQTITTKSQCLGSKCQIYNL